MDYPNNTTKSRKNKHLNYEERMLIQIRLKDGLSAYKIAKELERPINTVLNEIRRGTVDQIKAKKPVKIYYAEVGDDSYKRKRLASYRTRKYVSCFEFIKYAEEKMKKDSWSPDACVGEALLTNKFEKFQTVCTRTLYNYIDQGLLAIKNIDLPMKLRRSSKNHKSRENKKILGNSIENRPLEVNDRLEIGHWEIDTVIGEKSGRDKALMTLVERNTRYAIVVDVAGKTAQAITDAFKELKELHGDKFNEVFKSITSDNGSEFSNLSNLEIETGTKVYFTHPYSSYERGTNERHNGLIRRFIPKGKRISDYSSEVISSIEEWMNTLPRKILGYKTPDELFETYLDQIYKTTDKLSVISQI